MLQTLRASTQTLVLLVLETPIRTCHPRAVVQRSGKKLDTEKGASAPFSLDEQYNIT